MRYGLTTRTIRADKILGCVLAGRRPVLSELLKVPKKGDTLTVAKLDRRGRNAAVLSLIDTFHEKAISVGILNFGVDTAKPSGRLFLTLLADFAEFEGDR